LFILHVIVSTIYPQQLLYNSKNYDYITDLLFFQGLYKEDEREGPGVLSYHDGTQDVGLWKGEKLVKLCTAYPDAFTMENHKELDFNPEEHVLYLNTDDSEDAEIENESDEIFDYLPDSQYTERVTDLYSDSLDPRSLAINREEFDKEFFRHLGQEKNDQNEKVLAWNRTPSIVSLQKHVMKHKKVKVMHHSK